MKRSTRLWLSIIALLLSINLLSCEGEETVTLPASTAGTLDSSFGTGGKVTTAIGDSSDAHALAIQADGKSVVAGDSFNGSKIDFALVRYNIDGSLDSIFGTGGSVTTSVGTGTDVASAIAIQGDGKIVVAGASFNGANFDFALVRYNADGSLDSTFGAGGKVTTAIGSSDEATALAIQADGKIVVTGLSFNGTNNDFALARYNTDGSLDPTFGTGGKVTTDIDSGSDEIARALAIQGDGRITVAGKSFTGGKIVFALVRYNADGSLDSTFGAGGKVTTSIGNGNDDEAFALAIQADGKIVVAGLSLNGANVDFALVRYNADGSLDSTFGAGGKVTTSIGNGNDDEAFALAIQADGRIVVTGFSLNGVNLDFCLVRYNTDGSLDSTFGTGGKVTTAIGNSDDRARAVSIQSDGRIVVAGESFNGTNNNFALARYLP